MDSIHSDIFFDPEKRKEKILRLRKIRSIIETSKIGEYGDWLFVSRNFWPLLAPQLVIQLIRLDMRSQLCGLDRRRCEGERSSTGAQDGVGRLK